MNASVQLDLGQAQQALAERLASFGLGSLAMAVDAVQDAEAGLRAVVLRRVNDAVWLLRRSLSPNSEASQKTPASPTIAAACAGLWDQPVAIIATPEFRHPGETPCEARAGLLVAVMPNDGRAIRVVLDAAWAQGLEIAVPEGMTHIGGVIRHPDYGGDSRYFDGVSFAMRGLISSRKVINDVTGLTERDAKRLGDVVEALTALRIPVVCDLTWLGWAAAQRFVTDGLAPLAWASRFTADAAGWHVRGDRGQLAGSLRSAADNLAMARVPETTH